jgi:acetyl esterase/lipase
MSQLLQKVAPIGEARDREMLRNATTRVYRETPQGEIGAHLFFPPTGAPAPAEGRPAIVFFHGGFWDTAMPTQFVPHCLHFASRGAVAIAAETRVGSKHGTGPVKALEDARELIHLIRRNAAELGVDPAKITIGGAAGGAWLALLTALPKEKDLPAADGVDCRPQAVLLFSSLLNTAVRDMIARFPDKKTAKRLNPAKLVRRKLPPMILFHGKSDRVTPFDEAVKFARRLRWRRNTCELVDFERADHSFFNFNVSHLHFELTVAAADRFLTERGLLPPAVDDSGPSI